MLLAAAGSAPSRAPAERYVGNTLVTYRPDGTKEGYFYLTLSCRHLSFVRKLYTPPHKLNLTFPNKRAIIYNVCFVNLHLKSQSGDRSYGNRELNGQDLKYYYL